MKKLQWLLLLTFIILSPIEKIYWQPFSLRVYVQDLIVILFIVISVFKLVAMKKISISVFIARLCLLVFLVILVSLGSYVNLCGADYAYQQFLLGVIRLVEMNVFLLFGCYFVEGVSFRRAEQLLKMFMLGSLISISYGFAQLALQYYYKINIDDIIFEDILGLSLRRSGASEYLPNVFRVSSTYGDPNQFASYLILVITISLGIVLYGYFRHFRVPFLMLLTFILSIIAMGFTLSRSGTLGLALAFLLLVIYWRRNFITKRGFICVCIMFIIIVSVFSSASIREIVHARTVLTEGARFHLEKFGIGLNMIADSLYLTLLGVGLNNYDVRYEQLYGVSRWNPHSEWVNYYVETGLLGLLVYILFHSYWVILCYKRALKLGKSYLGYLCMLFLFGYVGLLVNNIFYMSMNLWFFVAYQILIFAFVRMKINLEGNT